MTDQEIFNKIRPIIAQQFDIPEQNISKDTSLTYDFGADSLDVAELWMKFENVFGFKTPSQNAAGSVLTLGDYVGQNITVGDCIKYIQRFSKKYSSVLWLAVTKQKRANITRQKLNSK